jgi:class 3 adenylate cyclase
MSFTVIGNTVKTAARLQTLTCTLGTPLVVADALVAAGKSPISRHRV